MSPGSFYLSCQFPYKTRRQSISEKSRYRKQYGDQKSDLIRSHSEVQILEINNTPTQHSETDEPRSSSAPQIDFSSTSVDDFSNSDFNENAKQHEVSNNNLIEEIFGSGIIKTSVSHFHAFNKNGYGGTAHDRRLNSISLDDSRKSFPDPYISIQEETSSQNRDSLNQITLRKTKRFAEYHHHHHHHPPKTANTFKRTATAIPPARKSVSDSIGGETEDDGESHIIRRSSSLSSIPSYFYPDPYSIVVSRYLEDLGSLSPYSTAGGSEATEYLRLSQAPSLISTPEAASKELVTNKPSESDIFLGTLSEAAQNESPDNNMNFDSALSTSEEYQSFRSSVPLKKICVEADGSKEWKVYDAGPRAVRTPLLCLGPACATADVFFRQMLTLTARGYRVISVEGPIYWTIDDWCKGLKKLLDCLNLDKVHIFGASLGGFLAQKFAEYTYHYPRVASLILCNTFLDTSIFDYHDTAMIFWMLPSVILKKLIVQNITTARIMDLDIAHAIEFMLERLNNITQQELASRMTLNCVNNHVDTFKLKQTKMTIMDVFDDSALSTQAREDLYQHYTDAKLAHLKNGGNFPYLSRSDEVNMHLMVHLRSFNGTKLSAQIENSSMRKVSNTVLISRPVTRQTNESNVSNKSAEDVLGSTAPLSFPTSSLIDENKEIKEQAATLLGLPVQ